MRYTMCLCLWSLTYPNADMTQIVELIRVDQGPIVVFVCP